MVRLWTWLRAVYAPPPACRALCRKVQDEVSAMAHAETLRAPPPGRLN